MWYVYILRCADASLYVGETSHPQYRRFRFAFDYVAGANLGVRQWRARPIDLWPMVWRLHLSHNVTTTLVARGVAVILTFQLTALPAFGQDRVFAPIEGRLFGDEYVLAPMAKDLRRTCSCVSAAFAMPRVPSGGSVNGPGLPLRYVDYEQMIRSRLERSWRGLADGEGARALSATPA